ncbi:MAG: hypothetical protein ACRCTA_00135, partial [Bacilli bacterium]
MRKGKTNFTIFAIILALLIGVYSFSRSIDSARTNRVWVRIQGGEAFERYNAVVATNDGNFIAVGTTDGSIPGAVNLGQSDATITKYSSDGQLIWNKQLGSDSTDILEFVTRTKDGNYVAVGTTYGSIEDHKSQGDIDGWIIKFDNDGNKLFTYQFGTTDSDYATGVEESSDGGFLITGHTIGSLHGNNNQDLGGYDGFVVRISSNGTHEWTKQLGTSENDYLSRIITLDNGNYLAAGYTFGNVPGYVNEGNRDIWIVLLDDKGNVLNQKLIGGEEHDELISIRKTKDGGFVGVGYSTGNIDGNINNGGMDGVMIKFSKDLEPEFINYQGTEGWEKLNDVIVLEDDSYLGVGEVYGAFPGYTSFGSEDFFASKTGKDGKVTSIYQSGSDRRDIFFGVDVLDSKYQI